MDDSFTVVFSTAYAWQSGIIRFMCHSPFSHCDIMLPEPKPHGMLGASDPGGVMLRTHDYQEFKTWHQATIRTPCARDVVALVQSQIGKPFDDVAMKQVLSDAPRDWKLPHAWFCSELIAWACEAAGMFRIAVPKNRVTPADLLLLLNHWIDPVEFWNTKRPMENIPPDLVPLVKASSPR